MYSIILAKYLPHRLLVALFVCLGLILPGPALAASLQQDLTPPEFGPELLIYAAEASPEGASQAEAEDDGLVSAAAASVGNATIIVNFREPGNLGACPTTITTWPADARTAFEYAASLWEGLIYSREPIVVDACWRTDLAPNVLGSAGPFIAGVSGANPSIPATSTYYPFGLLDAMFGSNVLSGPDIIAGFNDNFTNWYYGTDANPPTGANAEFDFVTVVLHELGHGLGVSGGASVATNGNGTLLFGSAQWPFIYSQFTKDGSDVPLLDYTQDSAALGNALRGGAGGVFFHGSSAKAANGGNPVPLYTPPTWNGGSSYSHLDEVYNGTANDLMTFSVSPGTALHSPGPITLALLKDIGWSWVNDTNMSRGLGGFTYDSNSDNGALDALGTLSIDFNFTHTGADELRNFYIVVNTANSATLNNATTLVNNGGVDSILAVDNAQLPGGNGIFSNGEMLTVPMIVDLAGAPWNLNFDVFATDEVSAAGVNYAIGSFSIDSSMFEGQLLQPRVYIPLLGN